MFYILRNVFSKMLFVFGKFYLSPNNLNYLQIIFLFLEKQSFFPEIIFKSTDIFNYLQIFYLSPGKKKLFYKIFMKVTG